MIDKVFFFIFLIVPLMLGLYFISVGTYEISLAKKSKSWPKTDGIITHSHYAGNYKSSPRLGDPMGAPDISLGYTYVVKGKNHTGERVIFGYMNNFFTSDSYRRSNIYLKNKTVTVFYNPEDASMSILEPGIHVPYSWNKVMIGLIVLFPVYILIYNLFRRKKGELLNE